MPGEYFIFRYLMQGQARPLHDDAERFDLFLHDIPPGPATPGILRRSVAAGVEAIRRMRAAG